MKIRTRAVVATVAAVAVLGSGGIALAATTTPSAGPTPTPTSSGTSTPGAAAHRGGHRDHLRLGSVTHGQFVTKDSRTGAFVTHDVVTGTVTAVSSGSIAVKAADGTAVTFSVSSATRVHVKGQAKGSTSTIASIRTGGTVLVVGTGTGPFAATSVIGR